MSNKTPDPSTPVRSDAKQKRQLLEQKLIRAMTAGVVVELEPKEAEMLGGAIENDSVSEEDALKCALDAMDHEGPVFLEDDDCTEIPTFITVTRASEDSEIRKALKEAGKALFEKLRGSST